LVSACSRGANLRALAAELAAAETAALLDRGESFTVDLNGEEFRVEEKHVDITIDNKEGYTVGIENNLFVVLDISLNKELKNEGYARELVSKIQQIRKEEDFAVTDNINVYYQADEEITAAIAEFEDYIKKETLAEKIYDEEKEEMESYDINGHQTGLAVEKL